MAPQQRDMRVESVGSLCDSTYAGGAAAIRPAPEATFSDDDDGGTLRSSSAMAAPGGKRSTLAPLKRCHVSDKGCIYKTNLILSRRLVLLLSMLQD